MIKDFDKRPGCVLRWAIGYELVSSIIAFALCIENLFESPEIDESLRWKYDPEALPFLGLFLVYSFVTYLLLKRKIRIGAILMMVASAIPCFLIFRQMQAYRMDMLAPAIIFFFGLVPYIIIVMVPTVIMGRALLKSESRDVRDSGR